MHFTIQPGLVSNYKESFLALKKETASLILQKLSTLPDSFTSFLSDYAHDHR